MAFKRDQFLNSLFKPLNVTFSQTPDEKHLVLLCPTKPPDDLLPNGFVAVDSELWMVHPDGKKASAQVENADTVLVGAIPGKLKPNAAGKVTAEFDCEEWKKNKSMTFGNFLSSHATMDQSYIANNIEFLNRKRMRKNEKLIDIFTKDFEEQVLDLNASI